MASACAALVFLALAHLAAAATAFTLAHDPSPITLRRMGVCARARVLSRGRQEREGGSGFGGAIGGAVLGGLLAGPFGAFWGAQLGASVGVSNAEKRQAQRSLERMGLRPEDLQLAQEVATDLREAEEALKMVGDVADAQKKRVAALQADAEKAYAKARDCLADGDESGARRWLERRSDLQAATTRATEELAESDERTRTMQQNVLALAERAAKIELLMSRSVSAASEARRSAPDDVPRGESAAASYEPLEDPLEARFRELEDK